MPFCIVQVVSILFLLEFLCYCNNLCILQNWPMPNWSAVWHMSAEIFFETTPKNTDKNSFSRRGLNYCSKMFEVKESWTNLSHGERFTKLQEELVSLMQDFFDWCREHTVLQESKLSRAITYALNYEETFKTVLEDGRVVLSNNIAERSRKNQLFSQSFERAKSSAAIMRFLETAKCHDLNTKKYRGQLLKLPNVATLANKEVLEAYLSWSKSTQENCGQKKVPKLQQILESFLCTSLLAAYDTFLLHLT